MGYFFAVLLTAGLALGGSSAARAEAVGSASAATKVKAVEGSRAAKAKKLKTPKKETYRLIDFLLIPALEVQKKRPRLNKEFSLKRPDPLLKGVPVLDGYCPDPNVIVIVCGSR